MLAAQYVSKMSGEKKAAATPGRGQDKPKAGAKGKAAGAAKGSAGKASGAAPAKAAATPVKLNLGGGDIKRWFD